MSNLARFGSTDLVLTGGGTSRQVDRAGREIMNAGGLDILRDDVKAAVVSNKMRRTTGLYWEAKELSAGDPGLSRLLALDVQDFALNRW